MEQLTPSEWAKEQLSRAPSFAVATAIVATLLVMSAFIEYSAARSQLELEIIHEIEMDKDEPIDLPEVRHEVKLNKPEMRKPMKAPEVKEPDAVPFKGTEDDAKVEFDPPDGPKTFDDLDRWDEFPKMTKVRVIGTGPTGGTLRGGLGDQRERQKQKAGRIYGMPPKTLRRTYLGLRWLKKAQDKQSGAWDVKRWGGSQTESICGVTGLASLAFLGFGVTDRHEEFGATVRKAIQFMIAQQHSEGKDTGWFGERMYTQGICTMALSEASVMLDNPMLRAKARRAAQGGLDYILSKQPTHGGFSYIGPGNDVSVTGWQIMAIKSAMLAKKLKVPSFAKERTENFLRLCMSRSHGTPYRFSPEGGTSGGTDRMTAVALTTRLFMGHPRKSRDCAGQAKWLTQDNRHLRIAERGSDFYYLYYMSMAMYQMGGDYWDEWNKVFNPALLSRQVKQGPDEGSWPLEGSSYGRHGGRVYTTAMACLALEVYYKHLPMYRSF